MREPVEFGIDELDRSAVHADAVLRCSEDDGGYPRDGLSDRAQEDRASDAADGSAGHLSQEGPE